MRALIVYPTMVLMTLVLGVPIVVLSLLGVRIDPDGVLGNAPRIWSRAALRLQAARAMPAPDDEARTRLQ